MSVSVFLEHQVSTCWSSDICAAKNTSNICWWSRVEVKCQKIRSDLATNLRWAGTIYISGLNYFDLEAWSCCDPAYQRRRNSLLNLNMDDIESWTLAQIQETKPNQSTPPRQMRNKTPARPRHRALTSQTSENNLSHRLFNVEHEYHFEVFKSHSLHTTFKHIMCIMILISLW